MLTLEIEYLTGVCFAAKSGQNPTEEPDWPPQPDRVFSALVAAWGTRGEQPQERAALEWLERQPPPMIEASEAEKRRIGIAYVPPGDSSALPEHRRRQPRMFPAAIPYRPVVRLNWSIQPEKETFDALQALARDTAYLGHSASVVRCRFALDAPPEAGLWRRPPSRRVYPGRLAELEHYYRQGERPLVGEPVAAPPEEPQELPQSIFSDQWIVLEDSGGQTPDLRAIAAVARRLRDALMSRYGEVGLAVPELISGHHPDGTPVNFPHMAIVPLADVGSQYSEGRLMGLAIVFPRDTDHERRKAERDWLAGLDDPSGLTEQWRTFDSLLSAVGELKLGSLGVWSISRTLTPSKWSLQPGRYARPARRWASVTPIVLDRFPKAKDLIERDAEMAAIIASSCQNIGLPAPRAVRLYKHAAIRGAPSAYPSGKAPEWTGWTLPGFLSKRMLTHAVIEFSEPVCGPVILGAGRYSGLGLCIGEQA
ncbi:MAG TPA: type I-U CRISPR-associated protein Csb2 [Bryobacteraceae bacterium]|nr:type I-U CRISPR-associated protein Csb2 [Bryobacteraceae bacterium]HPQ14600.1 type I-U CRISPR-associated protein Csb2 [Bryobacteraceae bacterium]HPU72477.1 type I-U CRISPR-associated protein Csb2 [Bryobacteraceae bacterium]